MAPDPRAGVVLVAEVPAIQLTPAWRGVTVVAAVPGPPGPPL